MTWTVAVNPLGPFLAVVYTGTVTPEELKQSAAETLDLARSHNIVRVLADTRGLQGGHSLADLYFLSDWLVQKQAFRLREAVLMPVSAAAQDNARLWETACFNRGLNVKVFNDRDAALTWLLEKETASA